MPVSPKVKIASFTVENFRSLRHLRLDGLGRVNLITGRNNTGKSSVLEALRILASDASGAVISSIFRYREEDIGEPDDTSRAFDFESLAQLASFFTGFPAISDIHDPIKLIANGGDRRLEVSIAMGWLSEEREPDGTRKLVTPQQDLFGAEALTPAFIVESGFGRRLLPLDSFRRLGARPRIYRTEFVDEPRLPCVFVSPYGGERTATLGPMWDKIALTDRERDVVKALRIIANDVEGVSMVGGEGRNVRTAIVRSKGFPRPVPLRSYGDGLNRLFGIVLSLASAKDGILLIDEFENGMHHTVQLDVWRAIFRLARELNVQVFASSHSWDAVETFQKAAAADASDGTLIRLTRRDDAIIPTFFRESELAVATREHIEVR